MRVLSIALLALVACGSSERTAYTQAVDAFCETASSCSTGPAPQDVLYDDAADCHGVWDDGFMDTTPACEAASVAYLTCLQGLDCDGLNAWNDGSTVSSPCDAENLAWEQCAP